MNRNISRLFVSVLVLAAFAFAVVRLMNTADATRPAELSVKTEGSEFVLSTDGAGAFYRTGREVSDGKLILLPESSTQVMTWKERGADGRDVSFYAVTLDGKTVSRIAEADNSLMLRLAKFDPLETAPELAGNLKSNNPNDEKGVYIVQFVTQPLEEYSKQIAAFGGKEFIYLPNNARLVQMDAETREKVKSLPFVRWVGNYEPAYKVEEFIRENLATNSLTKTRYNIMVLERGAEMQGKIAARVAALGGKVENIVKEGLRMEATLDANQLLQIAQENEVMFIDRWSAPESDMDIVREVGGANFIENTLGFKGQGVRAEVLDAGFLTTHTDFVSGLVPLMHGANNVDSHGTATYGINFGRGTSNILGRGMLPEAQGIMADYDSLTNRYTHTAELKQDPYKAVYQSNSWGSSLTAAYTTISAEMDDILFINDFTLLNSQSNAGTTQSRPQAWAKNVVSIGGISHQNTATLTDDRWTSASVGPAADGRIKPELAHFYDNIFTTTSTSNTAYTAGFNGTSSATPITAGHFGIFFQMWHNGLFGNAVGATVFDSSPHMTTTKAIMINTAVQWDMTIAGTNTTRVRQGWGRADLTSLYNLRNKLTIINETDVLTNLQTKTYTAAVPAGSTDPLKVTMIYADPMGSPSATRARINDLSLKVTAPNGTIYHGNNGMGVGGGMWSTAGGVANIVDTVENVYIQTPAAGNWTIEVTGADINTDARTETPGVIDADFALVIGGVPRTGNPTRTAFDYEGDGKADVSVFRPSNGSWYRLNSSNGAFAAVQFGANGDSVVPADYDNDGKTDQAVFRNGTWYMLRSTAGFGSVAFGQAGDLPVAADYDGDGKADQAVFRPASGTWFINRSTAGFQSVQFGTNGDVPTVGDFDGDGKADVAVFRASTGAWYRLNSGNGAFAAVQFGASGDRVVPADYDNDGKTDQAVFRPSNGVWYMLRSTAGFGSVQFGTNGDQPAAADYDGDGKADQAVFRSGNWYINRSTAGFSAVQFGSAGDTATESAYAR